MTFNWRAKAADLIRRVDPQCADRPVYILTAREASSAVTINGLLGCFGPLLTFQLKPIIDRCIGYRGPGFCCIINKKRHPIHYELEGTVLHEYAHHAEMLKSVDGLLAHCTIESLNFLPCEPVEWGGKPSQQPWDDHGSSFIRLCVHLAFRAQVFDGWLGDANDMLSPHYVLSRGLEYVEALGDEPQRLIDLPVSEIPAIDPPAEYQRFAIEDLNHAQERLRMLKRWQQPAKKNPPETGETTETKKARKT